MDIMTATKNLLNATMEFYGDCLFAYPELLTNPLLNAIEADMKKPVPPDIEAGQNPAYRMLAFLSEYKDCSGLPSYDAVYNAFEALTAVAPGEGRAA